LLWSLTVYNALLESTYINIPVIVICNSDNNLIFGYGLVSLTQEVIILLRKKMRNLKEKLLKK